MRPCLAEITTGADGEIPVEPKAGVADTDATGAAGEEGAVGAGVWVLVPVADRDDAAGDDAGPTVPVEVEVAVEVAVTGGGEMAALGEVDDGWALPVDPELIGGEPGEVPIGWESGAGVSG